MQNLIKQNITSLKLHKRNLVRIYKESKNWGKKKKKRKKKKYLKQKNGRRMNLAGTKVDGAASDSPKKESLDGVKWNVCFRIVKWYVTIGP